MCVLTDKKIMEHKTSKDYSNVYKAKFIQIQESYLNVVD